MFVRIDHSVDEPLYMQIRSQIIAGIAAGELSAGEALPSVRRLASDLGINLHTVNKAYAVLRDEGYIIMKGRAGAFVADSPAPDASDSFSVQMGAELERLAVAFRARGGCMDAFVKHAEAAARRAFDTRAERNHDEPFER